MCSCSHTYFTVHLSNQYGFSLKVITVGNEVHEKVK